MYNGEFVTHKRIYFLYLYKDTVRSYFLGFLSLATLVTSSGFSAASFTRFARIPTNLASALASRSVTYAENFFSSSEMTRAIALAGAWCPYWHNCSLQLSCHLHLLLGCVALLRLQLQTHRINIHPRQAQYPPAHSTYFLLVQWEENQFRFVLLQSLSVRLQRFHGLVSSSRIYRNPNSPGKSFVQTAGFQLGQGESFASPDFCVIAECGAMYHRS